MCFLIPVSLAYFLPPIFFSPSPSSLPIRGFFCYLKLCGKRGKKGRKSCNQTFLFKNHTAL